MKVYIEIMINECNSRELALACAKALIEVHENKKKAVILPEHDFNPVKLKQLHDLLWLD